MTLSSAAGPSTASGVAELGLTVMIGVPLVTLACTVKPPAKTDCVVTGPLSPGWTSTASVMRPEAVRTASRPAISLPSAVEVSSTAVGAASSTRCASASTLGTTSDSVSAAASST